MPADSESSRLGPSATEIIGPIVCGPSSSHTAGPCRIGNAVYDLCGRQMPVAVTFTLYNSLAGTGFLHGTHSALLAGVQGILPGDRRIWQALHLAAKHGLQHQFIE